MSAHAEETAIVVTPSTALEPKDLEQAFRVCEMLVKSGLLGKSVQRPEAALAIVMAGRELGLTAMQSLRSIHIIEGKPTLSADLMVALIKRSPTCKYFKLVESNAKVATYATDRDGEGETRMSFTIEEAFAAGLTGKNNWKQYPAAMLRARCVASLGRAVYPDLLMGIYESTSGEIEAKVETRRIIPTVNVTKDENLPVVVSIEMTEDEQFNHWDKILSSAGSKDDLKGFRVAFRAMEQSESLTSRLKSVYEAALKRINGQVESVNA